uniref:Importin N-terminal domain-containing protein n=1 Tax=Bicosoecida sp. CB-2014 TaxID=1486930 RepID=A0A7S1G649_9STRA|mmetsp:Transcript_19157/g.67637  ORF Transcript_19157/g.67637 Transcript_19157/m.67637 type:complete len:1059 (+) Transcript_19157:272-3448(+)
MEELKAVLESTMLADNDTRNAAEEHLKTLRGAPGFMPALMQLISGEHDPGTEATRLAAALQLKNAIKAHWTPLSEDDVRFSDEDRAYVLGAVIDVVMVEGVKPVRSALCDTAAYVCEQVYPDAWEEMPGKLLENVRSGEPGRVHNALLQLRYIAKVYEHREREARAPLDMIIEQSFPLLQEAFAHFLDLNTLEAATNMKLIVKYFWSCTQYLLPSVLADSETFFVWLDMFNALLAKPLPEASEGLEPVGQPTDVDARMAWPWWKAKKWVMQVVSRLFARYGNPKMVQDELVPFAETFVNRAALPLLETQIGLLRHRAAGGFVSDRVAMLCMCYLASACEPLPTWKLMKPHVEFLISDVICATLAFNHADNEMWEADPGEYVRRAYDSMAAITDPRNGAQNLAIDMARVRKYALPKMWTFIKNQLQAYKMTAAPDRDYAAKDGVLALLGSLERQIKASEKHMKQMETLLVQHVFPEFTSPIGFLRSRAVWVFGQYGDLPFRVKHHLGEAVRLSLNLFKDADVPVRYSAAVAFRFVLENESDAIEEVVTPIFPEIVEEYFGMMGELPVDDVVSALEHLIGRFGTLATEFAPELMSRLIECWRHYVDEGEDDEEIGMTAQNILDTCDTFLTAMQTAPERYPELEAIVGPVLMQLFDASGEGLEFLDSALEIFGTLAYFTPVISDDLWRIWLQITVAQREFAFDYISGMVPPTDTMIQRAPDTFCSAVDPATGLTFLQTAFGVAERTMEHGNESDATVASKIFISIFCHCKGRADEALPRIVGYVADKLCNVAKTSYYKVALANVIEAALLYNAELTIGALEEIGATAQVFSAIVEVAEAHKAFLPAKLGVLGFCSLLRVPPAALPESVTAGLGQVFATIVGRLVRMKEIEEHREEEAGDEEEDDDDDDDDGAGGAGGLAFGLADAADEDENTGFHDDEDGDDPEDAAYLAELEKINKQIQESRARGETFRFDVDDEDDNPDEETPVDNINSYIYFHETVEMWRSTADTNAALDSIVGAMEPSFAEAFEHFYVQGGQEKAEAEEQAAANAAQDAAAAATAGA